MTRISQLCLIPLISFAALQGCGLQKKKRNNDHVQPPLEVTESFIRPTDCRAHIKKAVCVVDRSSAAQIKRPCVADNSLYVAEYEKIHDELPALLQKMFCSVRHFYIESELNSLAYAQPVRYQGKIDGVIFGIRQSVFENAYTADTVMSWKEQTNFADAAEYQVDAELPRVVFKDNSSSNLLLHYVLVHEFAHFFDFANSVSSQSCRLQNPQDDECSYTDDSSWGGLSWEKPGVMKTSLKLVEPGTFCFYFCEEKNRSLPSFDAIYGAFEKMPFATTYATGNVLEDFAETFTFHVNSSTKVWEKSYLLPSGTSLPLTERFEGELLAKKRDFVQTLISNPEVRYP
jgi:hypothetical protein